MPFAPGVIGTDLNIAPLFLGGTNAPAMADATPTIEPMDIAVEPSAAVATEMQTVAVPPEIPEPAEVAQELAPAVPAEPQFVAGEAVVEEISEEATAAPAIGRADNDPRATPRAVTQLEVVKALAAVAGKTPRIVFVPREVIEREGGQQMREPLYFGTYFDMPPITTKIGKARERLHFEPLTFAEGLEQTFAAYLESGVRRTEIAFRFEDRLIALAGTSA